MLVIETKVIDGNKFTYTYSDAGYYIEREGVLYTEAYDPYSLKKERTYKETNVKIEENQEQLPVIE